MGWGDTSTAGDPGEQSAADASQSASVDSATAGSNAGSIGGVGGGNDGNETGTMDPGQMQGAGLNAGYGFAAQDAFNTAHGITATNPYGKQGFFSRVLGIDPNNIDYSQNMNLSTRLSIANNQFSKYANPTNTPGQLGYNDQYASAPPGQLRSGVQKAGYQTAYGPVMEQARQQSISEMIARGAMGLFGGLPGMVLGQIGTTEYGLPAQAGYQGLPGFDSFDPNNPRAGAGILGATMLGGLNTSQAAEKAAQAVDSLRARFSPTLAPTTNAGIGSLTPASYETRADIRNRVAPTAPTESLSTVDTFSLGPLEGPPQLIDQSTSPLNMDIGLDYPGTEFDRRVQGSFTETGGTMDDARKRALQAAFRSPSYDFYTDPQAGGTYPSAMAGEQLAGLFGENPKAAGFRDLEGMIKSIINKENLPGNQNMYGPGTPDLNDILNMYGMETVG